MTTLTQHGYLILADISGYTGYLAGVELEHAPAEQLARRRRSARVQMKLIA